MPVVSPLNVRLIAPVPPVVAAVAEADPVYPAALYDRALLLADVGRMDEARRWTDVYLARFPDAEDAAPLRIRVHAPAR